MFTIAARELRSYFTSPLAWAILGVVQFILAIVFAYSTDLFLSIQEQLVSVPNAPGLTDIVVKSVLMWLSIIMLLITPLLTMRLISEERRSKTLALLLSSPVSMTSIILGKFLGLVTFFLIMLAMVLLMPLSLLFGGNLDMGQFLSGIIGAILFATLFIAIGLYISTLTANPTVAAISTFGVLIFLWIIGWIGNADGESSELFAYISITNHFDNLLRGLFHSTDVLYYVIFTALFLILSIHRLDAERIQ